MSALGRQLPHQIAYQEGLLLGWKQLAKMRNFQREKMGVMSFTVTNEEIEHAMDKLNHRPRKTLGYRTPYVSCLKPGLR